MHADVGTSGAAAASAGPSSSAILTTAPPTLASSLLPASVAEQIRKAQIKAALAGQAPAAWAIGSRCQAVYSADGNYYGTIACTILTNLMICNSMTYACAVCASMCLYFVPHAYRYKGATG